MFSSRHFPNHFEKILIKVDAMVDSLRQARCSYRLFGIEQVADGDVGRPLVTVHPEGVIVAVLVR
jgi:hypothetical protein